MHEPWLAHAPLRPLPTMPAGACKPSETKTIAVAVAKQFQELFGLEAEPAASGIVCQKGVDGANTAVSFFILFTPKVCDCDMRAWSIGHACRRGRGRCEHRPA